MDACRGEIERTSHQWRMMRVSRGHVQCIPQVRKEGGKACIQGKPKISHMESKKLLNTTRMESQREKQSGKMLFLFIPKFSGCDWNFCFCVVVFCWHYSNTSTYKYRLSYLCRYSGKNDPTQR
jgi:hypothetical protein